MRTPRDAVMRELREEIGLTLHGRVRLACELEEITSFKRDLAAMLIVEDVIYGPPRFSWEIERIIEAPLDDLPAGLSPRTRKWIDRDPAEPVSMHRLFVAIRPPETSATP